MKRKLILVIALVCGLVAAVLTRVYLSAKEAEYSGELSRLRERFGSMEVLAFKRDTPAGTVVAKSDFVLRTVPGRGLDGQALTLENLEEIVGRRTTVAHRATEVVFWSDIEGGDPSRKGLAQTVKGQMRAMSVSVGGAAAVSGMVRPNDHVDVIGTFDFPGEDARARHGALVTQTLLQNVLVLATGKETANSRDRSLGSTAGYATVTLEVTPREAEMLAFAEQIKGRLVLTLRNRNDTSYETELPKVDFEKIRSEIESLNAIRQQKAKSR